MNREHDRALIDDVVSRFFGEFDNRNGRMPSADALTSLFVPGARIVQDLGDTCVSCSVAEFVEPRIRLLTGGTLVGFHEWETRATTGVTGSIAARRSSYAKRGVLDSQPYEGHGTKLIQLAKVPAGWRIAAVAWTDFA